MVRLLLSASLSLVCLLVESAALADGGPFPASNKIVFSPGDPNLIVVRATYGILMSRDRGRTWQYLCEGALGLPWETSVEPRIELTANNALIVGVGSTYHATFDGLNQSTDLGCSWNCMGGPLAGQAVSDVAVRADAPDVVLALTSTYQHNDAGGEYETQVFESGDDGAHWNALGAPFDPSVLVQTIAVAPTDPARIYLSGTRGASSQKTAALFVSTDHGAHWTERRLSQFDPNTEQYLWTAAVDPMDADRVYVRSNSPGLTSGRSRLFVTTDAGQTFQMILEFQVPAPSGPVEVDTGEVLAFALSPDGSKIYAGNKRDGLFVGTKSDWTFQRVNPSIAVQCLAARGNELWACSDALSGFIVGVSTDDGAHFCPKMTDIANLSGPIECGSAAGSSLACGATINGSACQQSFVQLCSSFWPDCHADGGDPCATGADSGSQLGAANGARTKSAGCGCSTAGARGAGGLFAVWAAFALACRRRGPLRRADAAANARIASGAGAALTKRE